jgi:hypothetical protein
MRALKDAVVHGVTEIESGEHLAARETFTEARDSWHAGEQKPGPEARGIEPCARRSSAC